MIDTGISDMNAQVNLKIYRYIEFYAFIQLIYS